MNRGSLISGTGHLVLVLGLVLGDWINDWLEFDTPLPEVADVMIFSEAEFARLVMPQPQAPALTDIPEAFEVPPVEVLPDEVPAAAPEPSGAPAVVESPVPDEPGQLESLQEEPGAPEITDGVPPELDDDLAVNVPVPDPVPLVPPDALSSDETPKPQEAPRIAPSPVIESPPGPEISETPVPRVSPESESMDEALDLPAAAPEEATTEIVTEAETPSAAPVASRIPRSRPEGMDEREVAQAMDAEPESQPPPVEQPEPELAPEQPSTDLSPVVGQAIAAAIAEDVKDTASTPISTPTLSADEIGALRTAVQRCWNLGAAGSAALEVVVTVGISMTRDGRPERVRLLRSSGGSGAAANIAYDVARRAILRCGVSGFDLPAERYEHWREIEITFNPEKMRLK